MANFHIIVSEVNKTAQNFGATKNELNRIQNVLEEAYLTARRAWSGANADKLMGMFSQNLKGFPAMTAFVDGAEKALLNATGNYDKNENEESKQVKAVLDAYH